MALPEESKPETKPNGLSKSDKKEKPFTKVVIRRLPPNIDQDTLVNQLSPIPDNNYMYLVKGDTSMGENAFARMYINFVNYEDIFDFKEKFDNYVFLDERGHEYTAVVEFSPFQRIPKKRNRVRLDPKCNSIESDPIYTEFLENLNKPQEPQDEKLEYSYQFNSEDKLDQSTPLLEFVKNRRLEKQRIREERREERKRKEIERKKFRDEERKQRFKEKRDDKDKSPSHKSKGKPEDNTSDAETAIKDGEEKSEKAETKEKPASSSKSDTKLESKSFEKSYYNKSQRYDKYEEKRKEIKPRFPSKKEFPTEKKDYRSKHDSYKKEPKENPRETHTSKYDDSREPKIKDDKFPKKVKKYSEKREELKLEAKKLEQKKAEQSIKNSEEAAEKPKNDPPKPIPKETSKIKEEYKKPYKTEKHKDAGAESSPRDKYERPKPKERFEGEKSEKSSEKSEREARRERIRNKDRPSIAIYRPGMLSKRNKGDESKDEPEK